MASGLGDGARRVREREHVAKCTDAPLTKERLRKSRSKGESGGDVHQSHVESNVFMQHLGWQ